jgi:hypothetical protein
MFNMLQETGTVKMRKNGYKHGGGKKLPFEEKKIMAFALVLGKHHKEFQKMITELAKKYR